jgi:hypothetical protein
MKMLSTEAGRLATLTLLALGVKVNAQNEKRIKLDFEMPLTDDNAALAPEQVVAALDAVSQLPHGIIESAICTEFEGQTIEFYPHPDHHAPQITIQNATVRKLLVYRPTPEEGATNAVYLQFTMTVKSDIELLTWAYKNLKATTFAQFHQTQPELALEGKGQETSSDDDDVSMPAENKSDVEETVPAQKRTGKRRAAVQ